MKHRRTSLIVLFILVALLGALQQLAFAYYLYWTLPWFDIVMHFLGGIVVGGAYVWVVTYEMPERFKKLRTFFSVFCFALVVGVAWELFEYLIGIDREYTTAVWRTDTFIDLVMDVSGAALSYIVFNFFNTHVKKN